MDINKLTRAAAEIGVHPTNMIKGFVLAKEAMGQDEDTYIEWMRHVHSKYDDMAEWAKKAHKTDILSTIVAIAQALLMMDLGSQNARKATQCLKALNRELEARVSTQIDENRKAAEN